MNQDDIRALDDCSMEIDNINKWIDKNQLDSNVRYLVSYAVVKSSGTLELVFKKMIYDFLSDSAKREARDFLVSTVIDSSCNPSTGNMNKIIEKFDGSRADKFTQLVKGTDDKAELNSLVQLRNDVAHGRTISQSINTIKKYYESGRHVLETLDSVLYTP